MSATSFTLPPGYTLLPEGRPAASRAWILWTCLAHIGLLVPQVTGLLHWSSKQGKLPFPPILCVSFFMVLNVLLLLPRRPVFSTTGLVIAGLGVLRLIDVACQRFGSPDTFASTATRLSLTLGFIILSLLICSAALRRSAIPACAAAVASILVSVGANLAEMAGYLKNSSVLGRAAGFIPDANDSAIAIICMLALILTLQRHFWFGVVMIAISFVGIFPTLSRSGFLVFALMVLAYFALNFREHAGKIILSTCLFMGIGVIAVAAMSMSTSARNDTNVQERIGAIFGGDTKKMESSERMKDLSDGWEGAMQKPFLGHGTGAGTFYWKPHNQFVSVWIEIGIVGAAMYLGILLVLIYKTCTQPRSALLCSLPVLAFVPFSQTLIDTPAYWLIAILAALHSCRRPIEFKLFGPQPHSPALSHGLTS